MVVPSIILLAGLEISHILTIISVVIGFGVSVLQIYVTMRLAKIKEEILHIMHKEIDSTIDKFESKMVTHKDLIALKDNIHLMLENISLKIESNQYKRQQSGNKGEIEK